MVRDAFRPLNIGKLIIMQNADDRIQPLGLAHSDVKTAFQYYLANYNLGGQSSLHRQRTIHFTRLIAEFFDDNPLRKQLAVAYLVGMATPLNRFASFGKSQLRSLDLPPVHTEEPA
jgi:hypothetical protein